MKQPLSLVTGACGFIGSHMVEVLHEAGHRIRATDLESASHKDDRTVGRFPSVVKQLADEFIPSDMTRVETLEPLVKDVDYVFHVASVFNYSAPWELLKKVNIIGARHLCDRLMDEGKMKKLVLWGAGGVYGWARPEDQPIAETLAPNPPNNYLKSKWQQEFDLMELGRKQDFPFSIIRPTTVYGPRAVYGGGQMVMSVMGMGMVMAPSNFTTHIPFIHVRDVCRAALFLAEHPETNGEIFNVNDDSMMTLVDYFEFMANLLGRPFVKVPPVPIGILRPTLMAVARLLQFVTGLTNTQSPLEADSADYIGREFTVSNAKLKKAGYEFLYPDARDGLRDTVRWYQENGWA